jgi:hypothetical protein
LTKNGGKVMFGFLFPKNDQVRVEAVDSNNVKTTYWRQLEPRGESTVTAVENELERTGKRYKRISAYYP